MLHKPSLGEANLSALIASVIGSIGGLFALGLIPAIIARNPEFLAVAPKMNILSFFICGGAGWLLGGQIGPRIVGPLTEKNGWIVGGIIGGLLPVSGVALMGWYLASQPAPH